MEKLFVLGEIKKEDSFAVAIVGSRKSTTYGREIAKNFSSYLAQNGVTIVSGLARGIDTIAHVTALEAGGRTIAVLGSSIDIIYPAENRKLAEKIIKSGAVVSQFPQGTLPLGKNFLTRNKTIVELSLAVLIIEGAKRSGTLSTASYAANLGVEVFAIPNPINSETSYAPNYLIDNGARVAQDPKDILEYLNNLPR